MKFWLALSLLFLCASTANAAPPVPATAGLESFTHVKRCVMENNAAYCHSIMTPSSYELFDRFASYKLMPCLPTDFVYDSEAAAGARITVKAIMPASDKLNYIIRLVFEGTDRPLLDIPESLHRGLGDNWQNKMQLAEQVYKMMRDNLGDKLTCDQLNDLIKK